MTDQALLDPVYTWYLGDTQMDWYEMLRFNHTSTTFKCMQIHARDFREQLQYVW